MDFRWGPSVETMEDGPGQSKEEGERRCVFVIKIICWEATVLPNALGSTVASQPKNANLGYLLWVIFWCFS